MKGHQPRGFGKSYSFGLPPGSSVSQSFFVALKKPYLREEISSGSFNGQRGRITSKRVRTIMVTASDYEESNESIDVVLHEGCSFASVNNLFRSQSLFTTRQSAAGS
jgi:hypothetical protein